MQPVGGHRLQVAGSNNVREFLASRLFNTLLDGLGIIIFLRSC